MAATNPLLTPERLAEIAARWEENMDATVVVLPRTATPDSEGDTTYSWASPGDNGLVTMRGRLRPGSAPAESSVRDQEEGRIAWDLQVPTRSRILGTDRLYVTGTDAVGGAYVRTLEVTGPDGPKTWEAVRVVKCWEVLP